MHNIKHTIYKQEAVNNTPSMRDSIASWYAGTDCPKFIGQESLNVPEGSSR